MCDLSTPLTDEETEAQAPSLPWLPRQLHPQPQHHHHHHPHPHLHPPPLGSPDRLSPPLLTRDEARGKPRERDVGLGRLGWLALPQRTRRCARGSGGRCRGHGRDQDTVHTAARGPCRSPAFRPQGRGPRAQVRPGGPPAVGQAGRAALGAPGPREPVLTSTPPPPWDLSMVASVSSAVRACNTPGGQAPGPL